MEERRKTGVYASCSYDDQSLQKLADWMNDHNDLIPMPVPLEKIHTTVVYSRAEFPCPIGKAIHLSDSQPFCPSGFTLLGKPEDEMACLVMLLDAEPLVHVHNFCVNEGAKHDYEDYIPHVTLSYRVPKDFDHSQIEIPDFCLKPNAIKFEPLDLNWCLQDDKNVI